MGGKIVTHREFSANETVRLGVTTSLEVAGVPESTHLRVEAVNDVLEVRLFVRLNTLFGEKVSLVLSALVNQVRHQLGQTVPKQCVEPGTKERIDVSLGVHHRQQR